jgi:hypothetical protein
MKEQFFDTVSKLVEINLQLFKLEIKQEVADLVVKFNFFLIIIIFANMIIVLGSFALAFFLGDLLGKPFYGFGVVTLTYATILAVMWINRKNIKILLKQKIQQDMLAKDNEATEKLLS